MAETVRIDLAPAATALGARSAEADSRSARRRSLFSPRVDFAAFFAALAEGSVAFLVGGLLGFAGFRLAPVTADFPSGCDQTVFGATLFLFIGWTFINIHHYFIDNVIWRRDNPEARRCLFGSGSR